MKTAIAILNWNGQELLKEFLPSVVSYSKNAGVYVIDNASDDDSVHYLQTEFPEVKIIRNPENFGFAKGYNFGIQQILKEDPAIEIFCLLNSDVQVTENWTEPILELFDSQPDIAAIQPKILDYKNPSKFEYAGAGGGFIDNFGYPYCRGRVFWTLEEDKAQYDDTLQVFWASGACLFIRTTDFLNTKGFDESFFAHMEEIDLCWRLNNSGRKVYYCGASKVYHLGGGTLKTNSPQKTYLNFRNNLGMLVKNLPKKKRFPIIFSRLFLDGITGIIFLFYEGFPHCWAIVRAHFGFYKRLPAYLKNTKSTQLIYFSKKWVPIQYFVKKRRYFSDLEG